MRLLSALGYDSCAPASVLLQSLLELHSNTGLLSAAGAQALAPVIQWMRGYGNEACIAPAEGPAAVPAAAGLG